MNEQITKFVAKAQFKFYLTFQNEMNFFFILNKFLMKFCPTIFNQLCQRIKIEKGEYPCNTFYFADTKLQVHVLRHVLIIKQVAVQSY